MTPQELYTLWQTVKAFREEMHPYFPTPNENDSLAFALTEVAEAVDAQLRQNPVYKRNNNKAHTVERELAQCAMMLLTSMENTDAMPDQYTPIDCTLSDVALFVAFAYSKTTDPFYRWVAIVRIAQLIDLPAELSAELDRMRAKYGKVQDDGPASLNEVANEHVVYIQPREGLRLADYADGDGIIKHLRLLSHRAILSP